MFDVFINNSSRSIVENSYWRCTTIYGGKGGGNIIEYKIQMCHRFLRFYQLSIMATVSRMIVRYQEYLRNGKILIRCTKMQLYMINQTKINQVFENILFLYNAELLHNSILPQFNL